LILVEGKIMVREDVWFKSNLPQDHAIQNTQNSSEQQKAEHDQAVDSPKKTRFAPEEGVIEQAAEPSAYVDVKNIIRGSRGNRGVPPARFAPQFAGAIDEINGVRAAPDGPWDLYKYDDKVEGGVATQEEYKGIGDKKVLHPVKSTGNEKPMNLLLQYKYKRDKEGKICQRKVRLCADGRSQKRNGFVGETFAPVISTAMMLMAMTLGVQAGLQFIQFDWNMAFLNADNDRLEYAKPPPGYPMPPGTDLLRIDKGLYGQLHSAHLWHEHMSKGLIDDGFIESPTAKCLYIRKAENGEPASLIFIHVDDGCLMTNDTAAAEKVLHSLNAKNELESEKMSWYIGLKVDETKDGIKISAPAYIDQMLTRFKMQDCNPVLTPADPNVILVANTGPRHECPYQEAVGSLLYLSNKCRPETAFRVNQLSRYNCNPSKEHWTAVKHLMRYFKGSKNKGICLQRNMPKGTTLLEAVKNCKIEVYTDSDYAMDRDTRKSTSGFCIYLNNNLIYWSSRKQACTAQSTAEAEMIAGCAGAKYAQYVRKALHEIWMILDGKHASMNKGEKNNVSVMINSPKPDLFIDNKAAEIVAKTGDFTKRMRHIDVRYYYLADQVKRNQISVNHIAGTENPADLFTKAVKLEVFNHLISQLVR